MTETGDPSLRVGTGHAEPSLQGGKRPRAATRTAVAVPPAHPLRPTVFLFSGLAEMVMLTALLQRLHRRYQLPSHVIGAGSWNAAIYQGNPDVGGVWSLGRHLPLLFDPLRPRALRALRESDPGPVYVCEDDCRQLTRIRRILASGGVNPARCVFITDEPQSLPEHLIDRLMRLGSRTPAMLRARDYPIPDEGDMDGPRLYVSDAERTRRDAWLQAKGWDNRQLILVHPGSHRMSRPRRPWRRAAAADQSWPAEHWAALLRRIHERMRNALIVLRGARQEEPMLREIQAAAALGAVVVASGRLRDFFALCEGAHSMISVDSGPAHAAAALGLPLVVLCGGTSPLQSQPRSASGSPVLGVGGPPASSIAQIPVDRVFEAWCSLAATTVAERRIL
jgi:heptosyltransferase-2/heptosyltransferase-3